MRPLSETLIHLIGFAEAVITRPAMQRVDTSFVELARDIRHAAAVPAEGIRTTQAALVMVIAIEEFFARDHESTSPWLMLAGATLPLLRGEAWAAVRNEKETRAL